MYLGKMVGESFHIYIITYIVLNVLPPCGHFLFSLHSPPPHSQVLQHLQLFLSTPFKGARFFKIFGNWKWDVSATVTF